MKNSPEPRETLTGARHVTVLMAMRDGARYLPDQLYSLKAQTHRNWSLIVSDDGSSDDGPALVRCFAGMMPDHDIRLVAGPRRGFAANFLSLLRHAPQDTGHVAFSDQDDAWLPGKLARALSLLDRVPPGQPAVYCGRTWICDARLRRMRPSGRHRHRPTFANAIIQSIGGGNTMVLNAAALALVRRASETVDTVASHDWWAYQIVAGCGGEIIFDDEPTVLYRQHGGNVIGAGDSLSEKLGRLRMVLRGQLRHWNDANIDALMRSRGLLTPEARRTLMGFMTARRSASGASARALRRAGIHHQTRLGTAVIFTAAMLGKL